MHVLKWLLAVMAGLVIAVLGVGLLLPDQAHVERSVFVASKPATAYTVLNGFRQFNRWSPWAELDPEARYTFEGPLMGVGARFSWASDDPNVGSGSQEIVESVPYERIRMRLVFSGFDSENHATFMLAPESEGTRIIWSYDSVFHGNLMGRYFGLMLDQFVGADYEKGLAKLKALVESLPQDDLTALPVEWVRTVAKPIAYSSGQTTAAQAESALSGAYAQIQAYFAANGIRAAEPPLAITRHFDEATKAWSFDAAMVPDRSDAPAPDGDGVRLGALYAGDALRVEHKGAYADMDAAYYALISYKTVAGFEDNGDSWEHYLSRPGAAEPAQWLTHIYWPVR